MLAVGYLWILNYQDVLFAFPKATLENFGVYIQINVESITITPFNKQSRSASSSENAVQFFYSKLDQVIHVTLT